MTIGIQYQIQREVFNLIRLNNEIKQRLIADNFAPYFLIEFR